MCETCNCKDEMIDETSTEFEKSWFIEKIKDFTDFTYKLDCKYKEIDGKDVFDGYTETIIATRKIT